MAMMDYAETRGMIAGVMREWDYAGDPEDRRDARKFMLEYISPYDWGQWVPEGRGLDPDVFRRAWRSVHREIDPGVVPYDKR